MRVVRRVLMAAALCALLASSVQAEVTLRLQNGGTVTGHATRYDGDTQTLYFHTEDGRDVSFTMEQLDGRSAYQVHRSLVPQDDAPGQLRLGNFARDVGLFAHSNRHYRYAARADPSLRAEIDAQTAIMRRMAAAYAMEQAEAALAADDRREAERWLTKLLQKLPDEPLAERAATMLDELYALVHGARDDELEAAAAELLATDLRRAKQRYDSMLDNNKRGLQARSGSQSRRFFERAIRDGERALRDIDSVARRRTDATSQEALAGYRRLASDQIIETRLNLASQFMAQTSFNRALAEVNAALALDPRSEAALAMRSRVDEASSRGFGWW